MTSVQKTETACVVITKGLSKTKLMELQRFKEWTLNSLIDYVTKHYHLVLKQNIAIVYDLAQKVTYKHSEKHPELSSLTAVLFHFFDDLLFHLKMEEQIFFPNIIQLVEKNSQVQSTRYTTYGLIKASAHDMQKEHVIAINKLKLFRRLTNEYKIPADASKSYISLFERMKEFENDLVLYVHLENSILFPKAIKADEELTEHERISEV